MDPWAEGERTGRMTENLTASEEAALRGKLRTGGMPDCPRCGIRLQATPVPPRSDISYVRHRVLLACDSCGLKVSLDGSPSGGR